MDHFCTGFDCISCILKPKSPEDDHVGEGIIAKDTRGWYVLTNVDGPRYETKFGALLQAAVDAHKGKACT